MRETFVKIESSEYVVDIAKFKKIISVNSNEFWKLDFGYWVIHLETKGVYLHFAPLKLNGIMLPQELQNKAFENEDYTLLSSHDLYIEDYKGLLEFISFSFGNWDDARRSLKIMGKGLYDPGEDDLPDKMKFEFQGFIEFEGYHFVGFDEDQIDSFFSVPTSNFVKQWKDTKKKECIVTFK